MLTAWQSYHKTYLCPSDYPIILSVDNRLILIPDNE